MSTVRITCDEPALDVTVGLDETPPGISGGAGGWDEVERPDKVNMTDWTSTPPYRMDLPLLLDGHSTDTNIQPLMNALLSLGRAIEGGSHPRPPVFNVSGPLPLLGIDWVLDDYDQGDETIINSAGVRTRQSMVLHLLEYVPPDLLQINIPKQGAAGKNKKKAKKKTVTTKKGDTLIKVAVRELKDKSQWQALSKLNNIRDPNKVLKPGTKLKLP
jgi:LysM repeat protein